MSETHITKHFFLRGGDKREWYAEALTNQNNLQALNTQDVEFQLTPDSENNKYRYNSLNTTKQRMEKW